MNKNRRKSLRINRKEFDQWIAALRSGNYTQSRSRLQTYDGYCCLGVACRVLIDKPIEIHGNLLGTTVANQPDAPLWLENIDNNFMALTGKYLISLNDSDDFTFDEIADLLELVYIHNILD